MRHCPAARVSATDGTATARGNRLQCSVLDQCQVAQARMHSAEAGARYYLGNQAGAACTRAGDLQRTEVACWRLPLVCLVCPTLPPAALTSLSVAFRCPGNRASSGGPTSIQFHFSAVAPSVHAARRSAPPLPAPLCADPVHPNSGSSSAT